jgi:hypothetical protein
MYNTQCIGRKECKECLSVKSYGVGIKRGVGEKNQTSNFYGYIYTIKRLLEVWRDKQLDKFATFRAENLGRPNGSPGF